MAGPPIEDRTIYLDRYTAAGAWSLDLAALMVPAEATQPSAMAVTAGNAAGHFTVSAGALSVSATGDAADMSGGTYALTVQGTWSAFGSATNTATLTVICPAASVYVDPATGSDAAAGTKAAPWVHAPDDPLATSVAAAYANPGVETLCVHKDGSFIRSRIAQTRSKLVHAAGVGWGSGLGTVTYCGADVCPAGTTPSAGEILSNPLSGILKYSFAAAQSPGQNMIDRTDGSLLHWAQFPPSGTDPFNDAYDPARHLTGGMYQGPASAVVEAGAASTLTLPAAFVTEFGSKDLTGALIGLWVKANFVNWFPITAYNTTTKVATFNLGGSAVQSNDSGNTAYQICGSPWSIKAAGQFAWSQDMKDRFCKTVSGTTPEIFVRTNGADLSSIASGAIYGLTFEGYWGNDDFTGNGVLINRGSAWTTSVLGIKTRWLSTFSSTGVGAGIRGLGGGVWTGLIEGNYIYDGVRSSGIRLGSAAPVVTIRSNRLKRLSSTALYVGPGNGSIVKWNHLENILGVHANGSTPAYTVGATAPVNDQMRFNTHTNVSRPLTKDACVGFISSDNIYEVDSSIHEPVRVYGAGATETFTRDVFVRRRGIATTYPALIAGSAGVLGTYSNCIIDGVAGGVDATFTNCLVTNHADNENPITANVAPDSGNTFAAKLWDGSFSPAWKQKLGVGLVGRYDYIYGIAVVAFTDLINQNISSLITHGWVLLSSDSTRPISITGGEFNIANDAAGTGAVGWSSTPTTVANGKYINVRLTTTSTYQNDNTLTLDLGDGNVFTWTVRTKQTAGFPLIATTISHNWKPTTAMPLGASTGKVFTFAFFGRIDSMPDFLTLFGHYAGGTNVAVNVELIANNKMRISGFNSAFAQIFEVSTPVLSGYFGQNIMLLLTVDTAQATAAAGVKCYVNGADLGTTTSALWTQNGLINFPLSNASITFGNNNGLLGMGYFNPVWMDLSDAAVRDHFNPWRIHTDGSGPTGAQPPFFMVGNAAAWNDTVTGFNLGTGTPFHKNGGTAITTLDSGGATAWPAYTFATALTTMAGPNGNVGSTKAYTVVLNGALADPMTINLSDGGRGGTFSPTSISALPSSDSQVLNFNYTPASTGATTLTASGTGLTSGTLGISVAAAAATAYTLTGAPGVVGVPQNLTLTLNGSNPSGISVALALSGVTGTFSDNPDVVPAGITSAIVIFTPTSAGNATITPTNSEGLTNPSPLVLAIASGGGGGGTSKRRGRRGLGLYPTMA